MSVPLFTKEDITRSTINNSSSKYMYSFSRAERFPPIKRKGFCDTFYKIPSSQMHRTTSFGIGNKYDFTQKRKGWNAEFYNVKRDFDKGNLRGLQYTFGICREKYEKVYYDTNKMIDKNIPGPGKYSVAKDLGKDALKYTMGGRLNTYAGSGSKYNITPGPGTYPPVVKINEKGKYPTSKIQNIKVSDFGASKTNRFFYKSIFFY